MTFYQEHTQKPMTKKWTYDPPPRMVSKFPATFALSDSRGEVLAYIQQRNRERAKQILNHPKRAPGAL